MRRYQAPGYPSNLPEQRAEFFEDRASARLALESATRIGAHARDAAEKIAREITSNALWADDQPRSVSEVADAINDAVARLMHREKFEEAGVLA